MKSTQGSWFTRVAMVLGVAVLLALAYGQRERLAAGQNDFASFYAGGQLAGSPDLYSREANMARIQSLIGAPMIGTTFVRPPFYAALLAPITMLDYLTAYALFVAALLGSIVWFVVRFSREVAELPIYASFGLPLLAPIIAGQDTPLLLAAVGVFILLLRRERDFAAGLVLSLCAIKFHLFLYVALLLVVKRKWSVVKGGAAGLGALNLLGLAVGGPAAYVGWVKTMLDPWIGPGPESLPNLHGLALTFGGGTAAEASLVMLALAMFLTIVWLSRSFEVTLAAALVTGLLTSFHTGPSDDILLFAVFVLVLRSSQEPALRVVTALTLMPVPFLLLLARSPYSTAVPLLLLCWLALGVRAVLKEHRVPAGPQLERFRGLT